MGDPLRSRLVIPAALLIGAAYLKGRWDACPASGAVAADAAPGTRPPAVPETAATLAPAAPAPMAPVAPAPAAPACAPARPVAEAGLDLAGLAEWSAQPATAPGRARPVLAPGDRELDRLAEWMGAPAARLVGAAAVASPDPDPELALLDEWAASLAAGAAAPLAKQEFSVAPAVRETGRFSLGGWASAAGHLAVCGVTFRERLGEPVDAGAVRLVLEAGDNVAYGGLVVLADPGFAPDEEGFTLMLAAAAPGVFAAAGRYEVLGG